MPYRKLWILILTASFIGGCLVNSHQEKIVGEKDQQRPVEFENPTALRIFTEAVKDRYPKNRDLGTSSFGIPFIIGAREDRILSENAFFNREVTRADLNADGEISEAEARAYARKWDE